MSGLLDPAADAVWGAVGSTITREGTRENTPTREDQWLALRRQALILAETANLLTIPARRVSAAPLPSEGPGVLSSEDIQRNLDANRLPFDALAEQLRRAGGTVLNAVDARDAAALASAGEVLDAACEACHASQWYPGQVIPALPVNPPPAPAPTPTSTNPARLVQ